MSIFLDLVLAGAVIAFLVYVGVLILGGACWFFTNTLPDLRLRWRYRREIRADKVTRYVLGYEQWLESQFDEEFEDLPGDLRESVRDPEGRREPKL